MGAKEQGADAAAGRWIVIPRTLCFVTHGEDILLLKRGPHKRVFPGRYNGLGGHIERDEDPQASAVREITEETGLTVRNPRLRGLINIDAGEANGIILFVYTAEAESRDFVDSDEGTLEWVPMTALGEKDLVEDLPIILARILENLPEPFSGHTSYNTDDKLVLRFA
jgi:8-oxo-dGTP diphosphatase